MTNLGAMLRRDVAPGELVATARQVAPLLDELWIVEDLEWPGGVAQLAAVLEATDNEHCGRPIIGHGVAPAPFRHPTALAMEWASLAGMYPGRLHAGIGHGVPRWMEQIGENVASPLTLLRETFESTRLLLNGGPVTYEGRYVTVRNVELVFPPERIPPLLAGVTGPKSLQLSGRVADGTVLSEGHDIDQVLAAQAQIATGRADRPEVDSVAKVAEHHRFTLYVGFYLGDLAKVPPQPTDGPAGWAAVSDSAEEIVGMLRPMVEVVDSLVLVPFGDTVEQVQRFAADVQPHLQT